MAQLGGLGSRQLRKWKSVHTVVKSWHAKGAVEGVGHVGIEERMGKRGVPRHRIPIERGTSTLTVCERHSRPSASPNPVRVPTVCIPQRGVEWRFGILSLVERLYRAVTSVRGD